MPLTVASATQKAAKVAFSHRGTFAVQPQSRATAQKMSSAPTMNQNRKKVEPVPSMKTLMP